MADRLERFLRGLHRRLVVLRALEGAGLGVLGGCVACLVVVPVLIHRGEAVWGAVGMLLGLGATLGLTWTALRPPRLMEAAGMADAQLRLADLLTSAWMVREQGDAMSRSVVAMATARATTSSINEVLLNRLGKRAWGGIGLAAALVVSMGLLSANPVETSASPDAPAKPPLARDDARKPPGAGELARHVARAPGAFADQPNGRDNALDPAQNTETGTDAKANENAGAAVANPDGSGGGAGQSRPKGRPTGTPETPGPAGATDPEQGAVASASGTRAGTGAGNEGVTGQRVGLPDRQAPPPPPWTAADWGQSRDAAEAAVRGGMVPAEYHDLIRAYFDRQ